MSHPFEVGKTYRNRAGEYVVQALDDDRMTIRYQDGRILVTSAQMQARIWENIQFERQMARAEERQRQALEARKTTRQRTARVKQARPKPTFGGFEASDFEPKKRGIAWSSRRELGRVLAKELSERTKATFDQWAAPRQSRVHVARKGSYDPEAREANASLYVAVNEKGVTYGFRVGRLPGKEEGDWPWARLVNALSDEKQVQPLLHSAQDAHHLRMDIYAMEISYGLVAQVTVEGNAFLWQHKDAEQEVQQTMNAQELATYLRSLAPNKRCGLYVRKRLSPQAAQQAGAKVVDEIIAVLEALVPLYDISVGAS
jgi:hypothetical protein